MPMIKSPTISIVVPVYNVENYLRKCIDSILRQSFKDFELLLIDDGSIDESAKICKWACDFDSRVSYYYKENGGLSDARNYGLKRIKGKYVSFIDSDDWVEENYLRYLYDALRNDDSDISTCVFNIRRGDFAKPWKKLPEKPVLLSGRDALLSLLCTDTVNVSANGKLFLSSLFADVRFPKGKRYEDVGTTWRLLDKARLVSVGGAPLYNYRMRSGSITHSGDMGIFDRSDLAREVYENLGSRGDNELAADAERYYVFHCLSVLHTVNLADSGQRNRARDLRKVVLSHKASVLSNPRTPRRDSIALMAITLGLRFYQFSWNVYALVSGRI
ncbi:MAG: glycosyltransferase [Olsenella sp.]|jgi:glycosyltransferase involved in cell wall biosynthesis|nr:glycosyltransferase [Olsenella sp.]MCI1645859.1 glycosyltransferase [Olsenella sp.]MCI1810763.1 glycosyltransferase [Olsenella sp.]